MNNKIHDDIEIMAPVGSYESLAAAIQGGAGSVYFGIEKLNMRAKSSINFTVEDLKEIVSICLQSNVKTYLTVNTVLYDNDLEQMRVVIDAAKKYKINAIIASDLAAIQYARSIDLEVHASTQINISNSESLKFFAQFCDVIVLARELNMDQVRHIHNTIIKEQIKGPSGNLIQIEMFIHGALCMAISGKCYLSLHEKSYSANRGACLQTCRKGYIITEKETGYELEVDNEYIMSPKDLKTIHFLNKILDAGVSVLKIEGRARSPEYVKTVTKCYKDAIDSINDGSYTAEKIEKWETKLEKVFNRGFWDGYYLGQRLGEWSHKYGSKATRKKEYIAKTTNYFTDIKVGEFLIESGKINVGDEILIIGPTTGVVEMKIEEIRVDLKPVKGAKKGETCSIKMDAFIRRSDKLYKWVNTNTLQ